MLAKPLAKQAFCCEAAADRRLPPDAGLHLEAHILCGVVYRQLHIVYTPSVVTMQLRA